MRTTVEPKVTVPALHQMKRDGRKIVGVVAWDYQIAQIADRAGVDIISVGDTVGINLWGHSTPLEVTMDEMIVVAAAVRRGTRRALVSVDFPFGPLQEGTEGAVRAAIRLVKEAGADIIKLDGAADFPDAVRAIARAGIPVFAQFGITPQTALQYGVDYAAMAKSGGAHVPPEMAGRLVAEAKLLEEAGAALLDFTNSGPLVGPQVTRAVSIPVIGGFGGGPWLDGRMRMAHAAIGYAASALDSVTENYANVARITLDALGAYADDVRAARQIKGAPAAGQILNASSVSGANSSRTGS
jgi:3-methyl-2-oxobutanoate hydroxymethyltransferase